MRFAFCLLASLTSAAFASSGSALHFTTDGHKVLVPYQKKMDWEGELTMEAWVYPDPAITSRFFNYVLSRNYSQFGYGFAIQGHQAKELNSGPSKVEIGKWTHIAVAISRNARKAYINGELATVSAGDSRPRAVALPLFIGNSNFQGQPGNQPTPFLGRIAEVRIWDVALDQSQIRHRMSRYLRGTEQHLLAYFPLIEGQGVLVHDYTGHLMSGHLGESYQPDENDPEWAEGPLLRGRKPRLHAARRA